MKRRLARSVVLVGMMVLALPLCLDVAYFVRGSLEWFPTDEQTDKVRRVAAFLAALLIAAEVGLWSLLRHLGRDPIRRGGTTEGAAPRLPDERRRSPHP